MASVNQPSGSSQSSQSDSRPAASCPELERLLHIQVPLIAVLATRTIRLNELLSLSVGSVIQLDRSVDQPLDLLANDRSLAAGVAVRAGDRLALQVTHLNPIGDTIRNLGPKAEPNPSSAPEKDSS